MGSIFKKLRVGVIGLGVGEQHIKGYQSHPNCEVVVLCDIDEEKQKMAREKYPQIKIVASADEILTDPHIDVVSIATYDDVHYEQVVKALEHNKHVFIEKPLCQYVEHACDIRVHLRARPHLKISSNLVLRKSPRFLEIQKLIVQGAFGNIFYVEADYNYGRLEKIVNGWRGKIEGYSGVFGGGVHIVDLLMWFTDDVIEEVSAYGNAIASYGSGFRNNDMVVSILKFKSGMIGKVAVNLGSVHPHFHPVALYGTKATFVNGLRHGVLYESRDPMIPPREIITEYPGASGDLLIPSFIDAILGKSEPIVTEDDVFRAMSVCFAIEKAHREKSPVQVEYI